MVSSAEADAAAGGKSEALVPKEGSTSKRQRRKEPNASNTWPQQPRIQSPAARAKAYLRVAGLSSKAPTTTQIDPSVELNSPEVRFGRLLGGTDQRKRHEAVAKLQGYLKARCDIDNTEGGISELDLLKLWKGMWYTLYMADKVPVQDELSKRLTELIWCVAGTEEEDEYAAQAYMVMCGGEQDGMFVEEDLVDDEDVIMEEIVNTLDENDSGDESNEKEEEGDGEDTDDEESQNDNELEEEVEEDQDDTLVKHCRGAHLASLFVKTFFITVLREWGNVDKHRVDKFYTLIRLMIQQIFKYMAIRHWNIGIIRLFNDVLFEEVLSRTPNGLRYHLIDITMEELANANAKAPMPLTEATFLDCLEPYFAMAQSVQDGLVHARIMENILSKFLYKYSVVNEIQEEELDPLLILDQVHVASVAQFIFELASDAATKDKYRKDLYDMHKTYMKRLKKVGRDVVLDMDDGSDAWAEEAMEDAVEGDSGAETKTHFSEIVEDDDDHDRPQKRSEARKKVEKKKKKKRKKSLDKADMVGTPSDVVEESSARESSLVNLEPATPVERKKRERKQRKKKEIKAVVRDEVITISSAEQKAAAAAARLSDCSPRGDTKKRDKAGKKKSKRSKDTHIDDSDNTERRVSFGKMNRSKSYKASMKDLKTMEQPTTASRSPDRSILLKKRKSGEGTRAGVDLVKKKQRKHATDYF